MEFLLRLEAVNLGNFIYDTTDLSTIRGGSLLLLECARDLPRHFPDLKCISTGASRGVFFFEAADERTAAEKRGAIEKYFAEHESFQHATIVVDIALMVGEFQTSLRTVEARGRWRQLQSPTVIYPGEGDNVCRFDRVRPKHEEMQKGVGEKPRPISRASFSRRSAGIGDKHHQFYEKYAGLPAKGVEFVNDFDQLSNLPRQGRLHHKIAVIYVDGNKFGRVFSKLDQTDYQAFAQQLQKDASAFLTEMLGQHLPPPRVSGKSDEWYWSGRVLTNMGEEKEKKDGLRLETLLWGGDEILWVVPAWAGWWWLQKFCELWGKDSGRTFGSQPLSYSAGLVFCHHDAPIHRVKDLTKELGDFAKPGPFRFAYQTLESFDHLGEDTARARSRRLPRALRDGEADSPFLSLPGESMGEIHRIAQDLKKLPRGRVHEVAIELCRRDDIEGALTIGGATLKKRELIPKFEEFCSALFPTAAAVNDEHRAAAWIHLNDLWDYLPKISWEKTNA